MTEIGEWFDGLDPSRRTIAVVLLLACLATLPLYGLGLWRLSGAAAPAQAQVTDNVAPPAGTGKQPASAEGRPDATASSAGSSGPNGPQTPEAGTPSAPAAPAAAPPHRAAPAAPAMEGPPDQRAAPPGQVRPPGQRGDDRDDDKRADKKERDDDKRRR